MKPITKFANTDFDIVDVDGRLFAITSYDRTWADAFECYVREVKERKSFYTHTAADWLFRKG